MDPAIHTIALAIHLHKVKLSVRFPCSLTFQLKMGILAVI